MAGRFLPAAHKQAIGHFASGVDGDEVRFMACPYRVMPADWHTNRDPAIRAHAAAALERFAP